MEEGVEGGEGRRESTSFSHLAGTCGDEEREKGEGRRGRYWHWRLGE